MARTTIRTWSVADQLRIRALYEHEKAGFLQRLANGETGVFSEAGGLIRVVTGVHEEFMGDPAPQGRGERLNFNQPAKPINCVNCGAPRVRASSACCDYCGSV